MAGGAAPEHSTRYVYKTDAAGKRATLAGMEAARRCFPYVLAFVPELAEMSLVEPGVVTTWRKGDVSSDPFTDGLHFIKVHVKSSPVTPEAADQATLDTLTIAVREVSPEPALPISLGVMLRDGQLLEVVPTELVPRLFAAGLPIVGTEDLPLPVVVHSNYFETPPDRTGLHASPPHRLWLQAHRGLS